VKGVLIGLHQIEHRAALRTCELAGTAFAIDGQDLKNLDQKLSRRALKTVLCQDYPRLSLGEVVCLCLVISRLQQLERHDFCDTAIVVKRNVVGADIVNAQLVFNVEAIDLRAF
ncbi:hypothetical protein, partial [Pseudomonas viridiflava]|uniref:hypothetical protein n=1 Tax=Pseudomonas viridiflava TaxID=33069 RepID=UPI0013DF95A3